MTCPCCGYSDQRKPTIQDLDPLRLSKLEGRVTARLLQSFGHYVPREMVLMAMYGDDPSGGPDTAENILSVTVGRLNKKLAHVDLKIEAKMGPFAGDRRIIFRSAA